MKVAILSIAEKNTFLIQNDPYGIIITVICMGVVFISLIFIYVFFHNFGKQFNRFSERRRFKKQGKHDEVLKIEISQSGEFNAAIALALYLYSNQLHDIESFKLTINRVSKNYSPWSSKIYGLRNYPKIYWDKSQRVKLN